MKKIHFLAIAALVAALTCGVSIVNAAECADLGADLSQKSTGSGVLTLQKFLRSSNYLSAEPNGYFGPSTFAAVKKFQAANGIDPTGYVGALTRAAIRAKSCSSSPQPSPQTSEPAPTRSYDITVPESGQTVTIGKTVTIRWKSEPRGVYDLILEDENGVASGYIVSNQIGGTSYSWKAGSISSASSDTKTAPQGNYQIRIRPTISGSAEQVSGVFHLDGPSLQVISVLPSSVKDDTETSILLYGRGFTSATSVYLDGIRNIRTARQYVSPDGRFLIFNLSGGVPTGAHIISLRNAYDEIPNAGTLIVE